MLETTKIRNGFGLRAIRNKRELRALIDFCYSELLEYTPTIKDIYYKQRYWVFLMTILFFNNSPSFEIVSKLKVFNPNQEIWLDIYHFIDEHVGYYWN